MVGRESLSPYDRAVADVLMHRLALQLYFRRPLSSGGNRGVPSATDRQPFIPSTTARLRRAETDVQESRGVFHWLRTPRDASGEELYRKLVLEWCELMGVDPELALGVGLAGIGRFLYPDSSVNITRSLTRLDAGERRAAADLIEVILMAEEVKFRSPLPCKEQMAALAIKSSMEVMLLTELAVAPPSHDRVGSLANPTYLAEDNERRKRMVGLRGGRLASLHNSQKRCPAYKGWHMATALFQQLLEASQSEECRRLDWVMELNLVEVCDKFLIHQAPPGLRFS